ncbi:GNAT family N-acetyltransferase [Rossellomorea marisflavi]|uniref:GNAT family N-acetyltransferase n=1 Tax=Rossellomorea marisflavi TaxID=189381 RepID=UPI003D2F20F3
MALKGSATPIGVIDLRIGHNENLYYGGHIGYAVHSEHRGHHYAGKAVLLLKELALAHGMEKMTITCNPDNLPSRKTCEYVGAELKGIVAVPPHNDLYQRGEKEKCIYELVW